MSHSVLRSRVLFINSKDRVLGTETDCYVKLPPALTPEVGQHPTGTPFSTPEQLRINVIELYIPVNETVLRTLDVRHVRLHTSLAAASITTSGSGITSCLVDLPVVPYITTNRGISYLFYRANDSTQGQIALSHRTIDTVRLSLLDQDGNVLPESILLPDHHWTLTLEIDTLRDYNQTLLKLVSSLLEFARYSFLAAAKPASFGGTGS